MWERYHLALGLVSLSVGLLIALGGHLTPRGRTRSLALAGLAGAGLGGWGSDRTGPWLVAAALVVLTADRPEPAHPLGRLTPALAVASLAGVWAAVPDTEAPLAAAAVLGPLAVLRAARGPAPGPAGTVALVVAVAGAAWVGSAGWGAALASAGAVGAVAVAPLVAGFGRELRGAAGAAVVAAHLVVALVVPRLLMHRSAGVAAAAAVGALVAVAVVVGVAAAAGSTNPTGGPGVRSDPGPPWRGRP